MKKTKKRRKSRKDENQMAFDVLAKITESDAARALGRKGGIARKANLSLARLTEIGKQGAAARWSKPREKSIVLPEPSE
jgi:hypothetical protein